jgi:hypothetical protein
MALILMSEIPRRAKPPKSKSAKPRSEEGAKSIEKKPPENGEAKKSETKGKEDVKKRQHMSAYERLIVIFTILNIILMGFNLYLTQENLEFHDMMYNFAPAWDVDTEKAFLESSEYSYRNDSVYRVTSFGYLEADIDFVTPHYSVLNITLNKFNLGDSPIISSEDRNNTKVSYANEYDRYHYIVASGLSHIEAQIYLKATVYPNPQNLPPKGESVQFTLGRLFLKVDMSDIQTDRLYHGKFSADIVVLIKVPL